MAKSEQEKAPAIKATEKDLIKKGVLIGAEFLAERPKHVIPVSPAADLGLNGGIPEGSWVAFSGKEKCGKTTLALHIASKAQQVENGQRPTFLFDIETRIKPMHLKGIRGLKLSGDPNDKTGLLVVRSVRGEIMSAEEFLTGATNVIKDNPGAIIIIDSTSALCSQKELSSSISGSTRAQGPKILAAFCRQMGPVVPVNDCIVISIQHLIANTSGFGPSQWEDSGRKIQYQGDVKLRAKGFQSWEDDGVQIGQTVDWSVLWSALGPPGATIKNWIKYGRGIDEVSEMIDIGLDFGLLRQGGSWFYFDYLLEEEHESIDDFCKDKAREDALKIQGRQNLYELLDGNDIFSAILYSKVKEMLC